MSPQSKREYLAAIVKRYRAASRKIKTAILNGDISGGHLRDVDVFSAFRSHSLTPSASNPLNDCLHGFLESVLIRDKKH
jgi:hypothetical protein